MRNVLSPRRVRHVLPRQSARSMVATAVLETFEERKMLSSTAVGYSLATHTQTTLSTAAAQASDAALDSALRSKGFDGIGGFLASLPGGGVSTSASADPAAVVSGLRNGKIFGTDDRVQVTNTTAFPYRATGQVNITFPDGGQFIGSGAMIDPFHVLTCGHCIYETSHGGYASSWTFSPGRNGGSDNPYGAANATYFRTYTDWVDNAAPKSDWAVVTLDRSVGTYTGWYGYEYDNNNDNYSGRGENSNGYPGDKPYGTMWHEYGTLDSVDDYELYFTGSLDVYGGQSGSPLYRYDSGTDQRYIDGLVAYESDSTNFATRITQDKYNYIQQWLAADTAPANYADLVDYDTQIGTNYTSFSSSGVKGTALNVSTPIYNVGTAAAGAFNVTFYATQDGQIDGNSVALGTTSVGSLGAFSSQTVSLSTVLPAALNEGYYNIAVSIDSGNAVTEFSKSNNVFVDGSYLQVQPDADDQLFEARSLGLGATANDSIDSPADVDMYKVSVLAGQRLGFDVDSAGFDTYLRVFDGSGTQLTASDDAAAPGETASLDPYAEYTFGAAGTYYVAVSNYSNRGFDPSNGSDTGLGATGSYSLHVTDPDGDDQIYSARSLSVGGTDSGSIEWLTDADLYKFTATAGQKLALDIDTPSGSTVNSYLRLFNTSGVQIATSNDAAAPGETVGKDSYLVYTFPTAGTYYAGVSAYPNTSYDPIGGLGDVSGNATGAYTISLSAVANAAPHITSLSDSPDPAVDGATVTLTANGVTDADGTVTHVKFYRETNGTAGFQASDLLLKDDTSSPFSATFGTAGLTAGTAYTYYAVATDNGGATGNVVSTTNTPKATEVIVDNKATTGVSVTGTWTSSTSISGYYGSNYLTDGNSSKGTRKVKFTPTLPKSGSYAVYVRWVSAANSATSVPYDVAYSGGSKTVYKNQKSGGGTWQLLGTYAFASGTGGSVTIRNAGTNGLVVADAVRFVKVTTVSDPVPTEAPVAPTALPPSIATTIFGDTKIKDDLLA